MKRITLLYALAATLMVCSGCSDFLEEHNRSAVTTEGGYYDTEKGFESLINSCYTPLRFWGGKSAAMAFSETGTDILAPGGGCDYPAIVSYQNDFDGTNPISKEYYDRFYKAINFCNTAIYHVKNVPFSDKALPVNEKQRCVSYGRIIIGFWWKHLEILIIRISHRSLLLWHLGKPRFQRFILIFLKIWIFVWIAGCLLRNRMEGVLRCGLPKL